METETHAGVVLVIDDDVDVVASIQHLLESEGYVAFAATTPERGLQLYAAHEHEIHAVVLDYHMPRWSGDTVLDRLRQINAEVCVIIVTGDDEAGQRLSREGLFAYLEKPFAPDAFLDRVAEAVATSSAAVSHAA